VSTEDTGCGPDDTGTRLAEALADLPAGPVHEHIFPLETPGLMSSGEPCECGKTPQQARADTMLAEALTAMEAAYPGGIRARLSVLGMQVPDEGAPEGVTGPGGGSLWRTRRVIVEARNFNPGTDYDEACGVVGWCGGRATDSGCEITTPDGVLLAAPGDWIVRLPDGDFYPLTPGMFGAVLARHISPFTPPDHAEAICVSEDANWEEIAARTGGTLRNREIAEGDEYETILEIPLRATESDRRTS
jgi:hypothetical protein